MSHETMSDREVESWILLELESYVLKKEPSRELVEKMLSIPEEQTRRVWSVLLERLKRSANE